MATSVGLDIGSQNIRVVELEKTKEGWLLHTYGSLSLSINSANAPTISSDENRKKIAREIKELFKKARVSKKEVNIALPESRVFTQIIETPKLNEKELTSAMEWQAEQYIPLPLEEVTFDYQIINSDMASDKMSVLLSAAPITLIDQYMTLLEASDLRILRIETQILSIVRALSRLVPEGSVAVLINLGHNSTDFAFVTKSSIFLVRSIPTGGNALTRAIAKEFGFSLEQAERYKRVYGIDSKKLEGKIINAVSPLLNQLSSELNKGFVFFKEKYPKKKVNLILLTGGGSLMPGIATFITENFGIETQRANSFSGIIFKDQVKVPAARGFDMSIAVGLAMSS